MPKTISTAIGFCCAGYLALGNYARSGNTVSLEAQAAKKAASVIVLNAEDSQSLFGEKAAAISELDSIAAECSEPNWDGYEAKALNPLAVQNAKNFLRVLPPGFPTPEFAALSNGNVSLDWIDSRFRLFTLSIGTDSRLAFAWVDGSNKGHGVDMFDGKAVSERMLYLINNTLEG